ncbi:hypothetical protein C8R44DRAFT_726035 [Mycena epipterygia]|nr:hypothetical protein C8R44DRAFT_726035 [Mycena epipterygia]
MPAKVRILAQFEHRYYIRGTLKRLTGVLTWLGAWWMCAWWICTRNPCCWCIAREEMPTKVVILAQFDHGYYIRGILKWLADVLTQLEAWWICTRNPCPRCLGGEEMPTKVMILAQFGHGYYIRGTLKRLMGVLVWLMAWWIRVKVKQVADQESMPLLPRQRGNAHKSHDFGSVWPWILYPCDFEEADGCFGLAHGLVDPYQKSIPLLPSEEEMPAKVVILAQFGHGYYIRGTLKWLADVFAQLKTSWIRVSVKQVTDQKSMPLLPRQQENAHKLMILAQFEVGYYIRGTLKRLTDDGDWLKAWWIHPKAWQISLSVKRVTDSKSMPLLPQQRRNAHKSHDFGSV